MVLVGGDPKRSAKRAHAQKQGSLRLAMVSHQGRQFMGMSKPAGIEVVAGTFEDGQVSNPREEQARPDVVFVERFPHSLPTPILSDLAVLPMLSSRLRRKALPTTTPQYVHSQSVPFPVMGYSQFGHATGCLGGCARPRHAVC